MSTDAMVKNQFANTGNARGGRSVPGLGRSLRVGNGNSLQYSSLEKNGSYHGDCLEERV